MVSNEIISGVVIQTVVTKAMQMISRNEDAATLLKEFSRCLLNLPGGQLTISALDEWVNRFSPSLRSVVQPIIKELRANDSQTLDTKIEASHSQFSTELWGDANRIIFNQKPDIRNKLLEVMTSPLNDSDDNMSRFCMRIVSYGSAGKKAATRILKVICDFPFEQRSKILGIFPSKTTQLLVLPGKVLRALRGAPISDEAVAAAEAKTSEIWERIRSNRASRASRKTH